MRANLLSGCKAWLLGPDWQTRLRVSVSAMAVVLSVVGGSLVVLLALSGFAPLQVAIGWIALSIAFNLTVLVCIRYGITRNLKDPALTQLQIWFAIASSAVGYALLGEARGLTPLILSMILMFGVLRLHPREMRHNLAFSLAAFVMAFGWRAWDPGPNYSPVLEFSYAVLIALVLLGSTFVGIRVQLIRQRLKQQKTALSEALVRIRHLAAHDELTGLANRRRMIGWLESEQLRCLRSQRPFMLALLDLDWFKKVNDEYGHAVGDVLLKAFADAVRGQLRSTDRLARWGGEEFLILMPQTSERSAVVLMQRVLAATALIRVDLPGGSVGTTVSAGIAAGNPGDAIDSVLERADQALYDAKAQGRARYIVHPSTHSQTDLANAERARALARRFQPREGGHMAPADARPAAENKMRRRTD